MATTKRLQRPTSAYFQVTRSEVDLNASASDKAQPGPAADEGFTLGHSSIPQTDHNATLTQEKDLGPGLGALDRGPRPSSSSETNVGIQEQEKETRLHDHISDHSSSSDTHAGANGETESGDGGSGDPEKGQAALEQTKSATPSKAEKMSTAQIAIIMMSLCMALFLAALDITIITTALPTIAGHFQATASEYTWVGSAYLLACSASVPLWGKLSDIWGRKPVIMFANLVFMAGSVLCATSVSIGMLIGSRVLQGIGGGGLVILVNICVSDLFSMRERAKYFGIVGMVWAVASAIGPVLGGLFTEKVSWRWCFYINLPLDGTAFIMLIFFLKLETPRTPFVKGIKAIDWVGVVTIVAGVVMFLLGLEAGGNTHPWASAYTLCLIIFGLVTIGIFFLNEWKLAKYPIMPLRLFNGRTNIAALVLCFCHGFVFIAGTYYLPLYYQNVLSATPILSGVYLFPLAISLSLTAAGAGVFIKKTGRYREPIWFGVFFMTLGTGLFIDLPPYASWSRIIVFQIIAGIGVGPNFQSPLIALQSHVHPSDIATATATFGFVRQLSTSISVVLGGVIFGNEVAKQGPYLARTLGPAVASRLSRSSFGSETQYLRTLPPAQKQIINQVYTSSLMKMWIFYTAVAVFGIFVSAFIGKKVLTQTHEKAKTGLEEQERVRLEMEEQKKLKGEEKKKERRRNEQHQQSGGGEEKKI